MKDNRPELQKLIAYEKVIYYLFINSTDLNDLKRLIELSAELQERGNELVSIRDSIDTTTAVGKAMFKCLLVLAEMERDLTSERTRAGLKSARAGDVKVEDLRRK